MPIFVWAHSINTRFLREGWKFHTAREVIDNLERLLGLAQKLAAEGKNPHAQALSALGASKGGKARAAKLSERKRKAIAKKAAAARWSKR